MTNTIFHPYSRDIEDESEHFSENSFLRKSESLPEMVVQGTICKEDDGIASAVSGPPESQKEEVDEQKDLEVASINIDDSFAVSDVNSIGQYSCHLCSYVCIRKKDFQEHLLTHYTYSCDLCDYASRTEGRLKRHIKDFHSSNSPENFSGQKLPSNNPKSLKCKHCGMISSTKEKHWSHQRTHLDVSKCLQCPNCPFITEYKHHLEYHIRNHEKIKPYKCAKCQYRCVNKSMLNSHKKSHSNVYQFRCADCSYASKYCHSLKQHLSRHGHQPAPVLNEDGSLPKYDNSNEILSMKRGPNNRSLISQNIACTVVDTTPTSIPNPRPDFSRNESAFCAFKRDQVDSLLTWTMKQCYPSPISRLLSSSFPMMHRMTPLLTLAPNNSFINQSFALDLSLKTKLDSELPFPQENRHPQSLECSICRMQFSNNILLETHRLYFGH